jgi:hypothetical protein
MSSEEKKSPKDQKPIGDPKPKKEPPAGDPKPQGAEPGDPAPEVDDPVAD